MRINILAGGLGGSVLDMQTDLSILHSNIEDTIEDLKDLKNKITRVNGGTHNLGVAIDGINNRIYSEETKKTNLETAAQKISTFLENTVYTDAAVARNVRQNQKDFFNDFPWMRPSEPNPEPSFWEKLADAWNDFWDAAGDIAENVINWVKENAVKLLIGVVAIVAGAVIAFFAGEAFLATLAVLFVGAVVQGIIGGIISGLLSFFSGGSFWEGFGEGFADGFMWGAIFSMIGSAISAIRHAIKGLNVFDDVANIADDIVGTADDAANVVDDAAGVVDDAAGAADDAAGVADDAANITNQRYADPNIPDDLSSVPDEAWDVLDHLDTHNGSPPNGYKGGKPYDNIPKNAECQKLPEGISYKEYDIAPKQKGVPRNDKRIVMGSDGSVWYSSDHYKTFIRIR